jgi:hypothetical protein
MPTPTRRLHWTIPLPLIDIAAAGSVKARFGVEAKLLRTIAE